MDKSHDVQAKCLSFFKLQRTLLPSAYNTAPRKTAFIDMANRLQESKPISQIKPAINVPGPTCYTSRLLYNRIILEANFHS